MSVESDIQQFKFFLAPRGTASRSYRRDPISSLIINSYRETFASTCLLLVKRLEKEMGKPAEVLILFTRRLSPMILVLAN